MILISVIVGKHHLYKISHRTVYHIDKFLTDLYLWKQGSKSGSESEHFPEFRIFIVKAPISTGSSKSMVKPTGFSTVDHKECLIEFQK